MSIPEDLQVFQKPKHDQTVILAETTDEWLGTDRIYLKMQECAIFKIKSYVY